MAPSVQLVQVECLSDDHFSGESDRADLTCEFLVTFRIGYICFDSLSRFAAHIRGANGFRDRGHVVQSFAAQ